MLLLFSHNNGAEKIFQEKVKRSNEVELLNLCLIYAIYEIEYGEQFVKEKSKYEISM